MNHVKLVWLGLWRQPVRITLTFLSITVAFLLFGLLHGLNQGMTSVVHDFRADRLYVMNQISMYHPVLLPYAHRIEQLPEVKDVAYWAYFVGYYKDPSETLPIVAADVPKLFAVYPELKVKPEALAAMARIKTGALVSKPLADRFGWKVGDRIPVKTFIWQKKDGSSDWYFDLVGTYVPAAAAPTFSDLFFINLDHFDAARAFGQGSVHLLIVQLKKPDTGTTVADKIDALFAASPFRTRTRSERAYAQVQWRQISDLSIIANAIVVAVLVTLLVVAASTMSQAVRERTPDLAVLRTLGFSGRRIFLLVCGEALLLCGLSAAVGLGLSVPVFPLVGELFGGIRLPPSVLPSGLGVAAAVAILSALLPAVRVMRLNISMALADQRE